MSTFCLIVSSTASAVSIDIDFQSENSTNPNYDPNATGLIRLFDFAAAYYGDIFEDAHDITINVWYEELDKVSADTLGAHTLESQGGNPSRETVANIRIDTSRTWFIDTTPDGNSEFVMERTLWRDIGNDERNDFYNFNFGANIPDAFEVGFSGTAKQGGPADSRIDMLGVVLHEVGHGLGMSGANRSTATQTADNDYDFDTDFIFGRSLAAVVAEDDDGDPDIAHLLSPWALMNPDAGVRTLPSHTDLFSMASGHLYSELDVPRREFYGGSDWNNDSNWSGNQEPHSNDEAFLAPTSTCTPDARSASSPRGNPVYNRLNARRDANLDGC